MLDKDQGNFFKDKLGRGWVVWVYSGPNRCFNIKCDSKAHYDMGRTTVGKQRREYLCYKCFDERREAFGLEMNEARFE